MQDMEQYKKKIKENIEGLINSGVLEEAKKIIKEYEELVTNDMDVYSFKGVIAMMECDMELSLMYLKEGIEVSGGNFDLYYNLAYLYESENKFRKACYYYKKASEFCSIEFNDKINEKIEELKTYYDYQEEELDSPKITIVTMVYNSKPYIDECIKSVLNQSFKDFEWVLLDNGCTDGTSEILKEYAKVDTRIKLYINEKNCFIYKSPHNFDYVDHINNFKSEYVCFLDSDDYLHIDFLKELYEIAKLNDVDISAAGVEMFNDENPQIRGDRCPPEFYTNDIKSLGEKDVFPNIYGCFRAMWGKLIKSSIAIKARKYIRFNNIQVSNGGDTIFSLTYLEFSNSVCFKNKALYYYRIRKTSIYNRDIGKKRYLDYIKIYFKSKKNLAAWDKINDDNLFFIASVLYSSMKDCIDVAASAINAPIEDRIELITAIVSDKEVRKILNDSCILMNLIDDAINGLNIIAKSNRKANN
ncbi:glycosyltransferase [Clostridium sporogenes]